MKSAILESSGPCGATPAGNRRRVFALGATLALSVLLHLALLGWVGSNWVLPGQEASLRTEAVSVSLVPGSVVSPPPEQPLPKPAPKPRPRSRPKAPPASPTAITPPRPAIAPPPLPPDAVAEADDAQPDVAAADEKDPARADARDEGKAADAKDERPSPAAQEAQKVEGPALPQPPVGRWRLRVYYGDYTSSASIAVFDYRIEVDGSRYRANTEGRAEGLTALIYSGVLSQSSSGRLTPHGLAPERYSEHRGSRPERWAAVDWDKREITFSGGERAPAVDGMQDRLSVLIQLGMMARADPQAFAAGKTVVIEELTLRDTQRTAYLVHGDEVLRIGDKEFRTLRIERTEPRKRDDPVIETWLAYDLGMVPVRIRVTDPGGRVLDQVLAQ